MKKVCLIYGFAEGPRISGRMRAELKRQGYGVVRNPSDANILLAHSGGCYMLPSEHGADLVLFVDPPMWLDRPPLAGLPTKLRTESKNWFWYKKTILNLWYFFSGFSRWPKMGRLIRTDSLHTGRAQVMVVRNKSDSFAHPDNVLARTSDRGWGVCSLMGGHDDLWENPMPYVELLARLYDKHGVAVG